MKKTVIFILALILTTGAMAVSSAAYLDPGAVSYMTQIFFMVAIAGAAAVGIFWKKIRLFFKNKGKKKPKSISDADSVSAFQTVSEEDGIIEPPTDDIIDPPTDKIMQKEE